MTRNIGALKWHWKRFTISGCWFARAAMAFSVSVNPLFGVVDLQKKILDTFLIS